jgi:hypothetical protein
MGLLMTLLLFKQQSILWQQHHQQVPQVVERSTFLRENLELPAGYTQQEREAARRKRDAEVFQRKNLEYQQQQRGNEPVAQMRKQGGAITEVWEDELDDYTIALLKKAGYTVEELD